MKVLLLAFFALFSFALGTPQNWALVVAGSNGYYNYRHQADAMHAYKMLREHGFDRNHLITMVYDDIANHPSNPIRGNIINFPGGPNVYSNDIDYRGNTVTAENFLKILFGDKNAMHGVGSGRVIESGPDDNIFVFFSDHGAPGIISFPVGGYLHAADLINTITKMHDAKKYHQMLLYIEACESGSMFDGKLPADLHVFAATAANPTESSWACYWDDDRNAYLGDTFAVTVLEDSDRADMASETIGTQFARAKSLTTESHVMQYGDTAILALTLNNFLMGRSSYLPIKMIANAAPQPLPRASFDQVNSRDIVLATLLRTLPKQAPGSPEQAAHMAAIDAELAHRHTADRRTRALVHAVTGTGLHELSPRRMNALEPQVRDCLPHAIAAYEAACGQFSDYSIDHVKTLAHLCELGVAPAEVAKSALKQCRL
eukprot:GAFH01001391.1.p1 GENE.GAFH01001391.1~~GAFH01001391.1.p1  ORF type:complete len:430 (+),score=161.25 GAFH01001391.1:32-1321(+)